MDASVHRPPDVLTDTLHWIEAHLDDPLTLEQIARQAGLSAYHFSRLFAARTGHGVMEHVRSRRLIRSASRLTQDPDLTLIDLALDSGFESQEAFTRAFKRVFGVSPGRFRRGFSVNPIAYQYPPQIPETLMPQTIRHPDLARFTEFWVAGYSDHFDQDSKARIPQLWSRLIGHLPFEAQVPSMCSFGVVWRTSATAGAFEYMAGVEVVPDAPLPDGMHRKCIPGGSYLHFTIPLNGGPVHPQVKAAMADIWGRQIPASGLQVIDGPDFERYDGDFAPDQPDQIIEYYVPVGP